jgi:hypothetical protein
VDSGGALVCARGYAIDAFEESEMRGLGTAVVVRAVRV